MFRVSGFYSLYLLFLSLGRTLSGGVACVQGYVGH